MGKPFDTDPKILKDQAINETYPSRGPGGQQKNKTETAVRLTHVPSEIIVTEYRSQPQNRKLAFERLRDQLQRLNRSQKRRIPTSVKE